MGQARIVHRTNLRAFILGAAKAAHPHWDVTRVDPELMEMFEYKFRELIRKSLRNHPPQGKTVRGLY
ncbi:MAG TPA: hypothetical protein VLM89_14020 [Phycisphaerae bacterium]|nr:hypothetical protein [Phycisphaerae bacterium]